MMHAHAFPQTRWTLVLSAKGDGCEVTSKKAWEELALAYWKPIYAYCRGKGHSHEVAQDETQAFFAHLLDRDVLSKIQPEGARFRRFLLVCLNHRLIDEHRSKIKVKQRCEISMESWEEMEAVKGKGMLFPSAASPEEAFDRAWAEEVIRAAMARLARRWENRSELFAELRFSVESPGDGSKYADIAAKLKMTEGAVGKAAFDLRRQFVDEVRGEIRNTVAADADVDEELRYLASLWMRR